MPNFYQAEYRKLAAAFRLCQPPEIEMIERIQHYHDCKTIANMLEVDNPNFNRNIFLKSCGYIDAVGQPHLPTLENKREPSTTTPTIS